jgi:hypothetical protein
MVPSRAADPSFAATRNDTLPLPWPDVGDSPVIQVALVDAVQAHSGRAVTVIALLPPAASSMAGGATVTWHLTGVGPDDVSDDVSQPATIAAAATKHTAVTKRRIVGWTRLATGSTVVTADWQLSKRHSMSALTQPHRSLRFD